MGNSVVTAVIVSYRSAALTAQAIVALDQARQLTGFPDQLVVIDNDSGDAEEIERAILANGYAHWAHLLRAPRNGGFGYGNNFAMAWALERSPVRYFWLLNPDTIPRPDSAVPLVNCLESRRDVGIVGSGFDNADGSDWPISFRFPSALSEFEQGIRWGVISRWLSKWVVARVMPKEPAIVDWVAGASMMIRADLAVQLGGFDEGFFLYFEETDLCRRALKLGYLTCYQPDSRVMHIAGCSTQLTQRNAPPPRMPGYWFESRRRYFLLQSGLVGAVFIDVLAIFGLLIGEAKRFFLRRPTNGPKFFLIDLLTHSVLFGRGWGLILRQPKKGSLSYEKV